MSALKDFVEEVSAKIARELSSVSALQVFMACPEKKCSWLKPGHFLIKAKMDLQIHIGVYFKRLFFLEKDFTCHTTNESA